MVLTNQNSHMELKNNIIQNLIRKISALQKKYDMMYECSPDLFRTINTEGIILNCNELYARTLGYSKEELIGTSIFDTVTDASLEVMHNSLETWKKTGHVKNIEVWLKRKDGITIPVLISANNMYDEDGNMTGSNTILRDMSEFYLRRKKQVDSEKRIEEISNQSEKHEECRKEFVHMISDELRSATIPIIKSVDILLSRQLGDVNISQLNELKKIRFKSKSILKMVYDILYMNMIEDDELNLTITKCNLSKLVTDVISEMSEDADYHGSLIVADQIENLYCPCDEEKVKEVLTQLIGNAIDFSPLGYGMIDVKLYKEDRYVKIIVKDNGIGIRMNRLEKVFEKFYQMDTSILREHGGAGLGLSICKGIIEGHKGKIWAESHGTGAEIHVLLPIG